MGSSSSSFSSSCAAEMEVEDGGLRCARRKVVTSRCRTEEVDGRLIRKCDKTEQLLRDCVGRPAEVMESSTEHTEEDVTDQRAGYSVSLEYSGDVFSIGGLRSDIEAIQRSMQGGLSHFLEMAQEMKDELFGTPSHRGDDWSPPATNRQIPVEGSIDKGGQLGDSDVADLPGELRDV